MQHFFYLVNQILLTKNLFQLHLLGGYGAFRNGESPWPPSSSIHIYMFCCVCFQMMLQYSVADFAYASEFLSLLARRLGRLKKGGIPDVVKAGKTVLQDWNKLVLQACDNVVLKDASSSVNKF